MFMKANGAKLWIVMGRPTRLPGALVAVQSIGGQFPGGCHLLRDDSSWWQLSDWQRFAGHFSGVHRFCRVRSCRGLIDLPRLYRDLAGRKAELAALDINPAGDVLLCLASITGVANAATSAHPSVPKILCISKWDYERMNQSPDRVRFRFTTSGWLQNRLVEPLIGLERTLHFKPRLNPGGDGVRLVRLEKAPTEIYNVSVIMSNSGREMPAARGEELVASRFPSLAELDAETSDRGEASERRSIVFFGTPFLLVQNLPPNEYVTGLNRCLDFVRKYHSDCDWIYRPHPGETAEADRLNLIGFKIENDREAAELYFLRRFRAIEAVYSVSSTVSRVALNNGLNAYTFWRCFPFPETATRFFARTMGDVPPEFDITDLGKPPIAYQQMRKPDPDTRSFGEALRLALKTVRDA